MCPYNGSGVYELPSNTFNPAVANTEIDADDWNTSAADLETALSSVITKDGQTTTTASIPFADGVTINNTGLKILDTNASHTLAIVPGSDLGANRTLTLTTGDANRTISMAGNLTFAGSITSSGAFPITLTATAATSVTLPTSGTLLSTTSGYVSSIAGTANEITASAATGAVTLSLPSALTFTGKTITGGTYATITYGGVTLSNSVTGTGSMVLSASPTITGALAVTDGAEGLITVGAGGTGATTPTIVLNGGSASGGGTYIDFKRNSVTKGYIGTVSSVIGGTSDDIALFASSSGAIRLYSNGGNERACVASDGSFLVGTTTNSGWRGSAKMEVQTSGDGVSSYVSSGSGYAFLGRVDNTGALLAGFYYTTTAVGSITTNGTTTAYNTTSDESVKNFNVAQRDFGAIIDAIMVRDAVYKAQPTIDNRVLSISAQQTAASGYWDAITPANPNDENALWQADYGRLAPLALWGVKDLRARVAELENTVANLNQRISALEEAR